MSRNFEEQCLILGVMSETEYEPTTVIAKRCGLTMPTANRHLHAMPNLVEWNLRKVVRPSRNGSAQLYYWRRKIGALDRLRRPGVAARRGSAC